MLGEKTITGAMPQLEIDLSTCEQGAPCIGGYLCRIHRVRAFLKALGWVDDPPPASEPKVAA